MNKNKQYNVLCAIIILFISSCSISKQSTRTMKLDIPESYKEQRLSVTADTIMLPWRTFFKDSILVELIEKALERNSDVEVALMSMKQLEISYKQAKYELLPALEMNVGSSRTWASKNSINAMLSGQLTAGPADDYNANLNLSWEIDIWGKAKMQKESALANFFAQKENLSALKTRIIVEVAQAYYNLISLDEQLKVAQLNICLGDSTINMIRLQYSSGWVNALALEQAEAQKKTAELLVPLARQSIAIQENALSILCGSYPENIKRSGSLSAAMPEDVFPIGVPAMLLSRRPDVKAAEYAVISANSKIGLAKAAMYPAISLTSSVGTNSSKINNWFELPGSIVKNVGVNLTQPILQKRLLKTNYEIVKLEHEKAAIQFKQSIMIAVGEVSDALATLKHCNERLELIKYKTALLSKATNDALLLYGSGLATYLEVITTQDNALQNELEAISINREKLFALTDLYRALGGM